MEQYLTALDEIEARLVAAERWIDIPLKPQDVSHLNLDASPEGEPAEYYRNMFDLIALAFDADITRSVAFMLNREDGMGISDTFPLKLGLGQTHHSLSHAGDKDGQLAFAKYDLFLSQQIAGFLSRLQSYRDIDGSVLDNTIVLFGSAPAPPTTPPICPRWSRAATGWGSSMAVTGVRTTRGCRICSSASSARSSSMSKPSATAPEPWAIRSSRSE